MMRFTSAQPKGHPRDNKPRVGMRVLEHEQYYYPQQRAVFVSNANRKQCNAFRLMRVHIWFCCGRHRIVLRNTRNMRVF